MLQDARKNKAKDSGEVGAGIQGQEQIISEPQNTFCRQIETFGNDMKTQVGLLANCYVKAVTP